MKQTSLLLPLICALAIAGPAFAGPSTTVVSSSAAPSASYGQSITFTATITGAIPTGTVTWSVNTGCAIATVSSRTATCITSALPVGNSNTVEADYSGDANNSPSSGTLTQQVVQASTTTAVVSSISPSTFGQSVTFTATITNTASGLTASNATGSVQWMGDISGCANSTVSAGVATCIISTLSVGSHNNIAAQYPGDTNYNNSTAPAITQAVTKTSPSLTVTSSGSPSTFGQSVTFTATITGGVSPSGTVTWSANTGCAASTVSSATATCVTSVLPVASSQAITAAYGGDGNNATAGGSLTNGQTVNKSSPTVTVTSSLNPSTYNQSVTFTATLTGGASPTGTVTWSANTGCANFTLASTTATCVTSTLAGGTPSVVATYLGDTNNQGNSGSITQTVNTVTTAVSVTSATNPSSFGQSVRFTATITGGVSPTGTVSWSANTGCSASAVSSATATCTTSILPVGAADAVSATYSGDSNNATSTGTLGGAQAVNKATPVITISSASNPSTYGAQVTFTATITAVSGTPPQGATGSVTWSVNANCAVSTVSAGTATCTTAAGSPLALGANTITATYSGDANYLTGTSAGFTQTVNQASSTITVTSSANPSTYNASVTFTATITGTSPVNGTVTWVVNGATLNSCSPATVASGTAVCVTSALPGGTNTVTADYSGNSNNAAGNGTLTGGQVVNPAAQTISFGTLSDVTYGSSPVTLSATATSNLLVAYGSNSNTVCTVSGSTVSIVGIGICSITASQSGNSNYAAAPSVTQTFTVRGPTTLSATAGTSPQSAAAGSAFAIPLQVNVVDSKGNLVSGVPVTFTAPPTGATAVFSNNSNTISVVTVGGYATTTVTAGTAPGNYSVATSIQGALGVNVAATATFILTNLSGVPATITGSNESAQINGTYAPLSVTVRDQAGNLVSDGTAVTFTVAGCPPGSGAANAYFTNTILSTQSCGDAETTTSGIATTRTALVANTAPGTFSINVTAGTASGTLSLTNTAGSANSVVLVSGDKQLVSLNHQFAPLVVEVEDSFGNGVANVPVTFTVTPSSAGATGNFSGSNIIQTGAGGTASLTGFTANNTPGSYTVTAAATINVTGGGTVTGSYTFTLTNLASLNITAISPTSASENSSGGVTITITGSAASGFGFGNSDSVQFTRGSVATTLAGASVNSVTKITATIPASLLAIPTGSSPLTAPETETITVVGPDGSASNPYPFTLNPPPSASSVSPTSPNVGDPNFVLTVAGSNFVSPSVLITAASGKSSTVTPSSIQASSLTVPLPPGVLTSFAPAVSGSSSSVPLTVSVIDSGTTSTLSNGLSLVFPTIASLNPASVASGGVAFTMTVNGTNFIAGSVVHWCASGCTPATGDISLATVLVSSTQLQATVPAAYISQTGSAIVTVVNEAAYPAQTASGQAMFNFGGLQLNSVSPTTAQAGASSALTLTLTGSNFQPDAIVHWVNGSQDTALATSVGTTNNNGGLSSTQLTAVVPASLLENTGTVSINVHNVADNSQSNPLAFNIVQSAITSLSPASAPAGSSPVTLTIDGSNFLSGLTVQLTINGGAVTLTPTQTSPSQVTVIIPSAQLSTAGKGQISVVNSGAVSSNSFEFDVNNPSITALLPASVAVSAPTFQLAVAGTNFLSGSVVDWNDGTKVTALSTTFTNSSSLSAIVPSSLLAATESAVITVLNPGTGSPAPVSNSFSFAVGPAPTIASVATGGLSPATVAAGSPSFVMTVTGTNFSASSVVVWDPGTGTTTKLTTYLADTVNFTSLTATVPAALLTAPGNVTITVLNPGPVISNPDQFVISGGSAPVITNLTPNSATAGVATAVQVSIIGAGFESAGSTVQFNGSGTSMTLTPVFVSTGQLNVSVPATLFATAGNATVSVSTPAGGVSNTATFTVNQPNQVSITSLQYTTSAAGTISLLETVTGQFFVSGSVVQWGNGITTTPVATQYVNSTTLTAIIPAADLATPGVAFVSVLNPDKTVSNTALFTITGALPAITSLSQSSAAAGSPGFTLTVNGTGYTTSGTTVYWGTTALPTLFVSAAQLSVTLTSSLLATPGSISVSVQAAGGTSNIVAFSIGGPTILVLAPSSASVGAADLTLSVGGQNFISGATVMWQTTALTTTFISSSQLSAAVPAALLATAGAVNITVQNPGGAASGPSPFTVGTGPAIASIVPATATAGSGAFNITLSGSNFASGDQILWNGVPLTTTFTSASQLSAAVPASLTNFASSVNVEVLHTNGVLSNLMQVVLAGPAITSVAPATAAAGSASAQLTITGTNFIPQSAVQWNAAAIPTAYVNATTLTAQVGSALLLNPGTAFLTVSNGSANSVPSAFTVVGPTLSSLAPGTAVAGSGALALTVTGTNFASGAIVNWNGTQVATSFVSATQLTAIVPATLTTAAGINIVNVTNPGNSGSGITVFVLSAPPAATITSFAPASTIAGSQAFVLTVTGTGFNSTSMVIWNGTSLPTTYSSATQITAFVNSTLLALPAQANVTVVNSGAAASATALFSVSGPTISSLSPNTSSAGGPAFNLSVTGTNYLQGSVIQWNSVSLPTAYNSPTSLTASVPASLVTAGGTASVTVQNPGGATSPASTFTIGPFTLSFTTVSLPDAIVGQIYSAPALQATGGTAPYTWSITGGVIPQGLSIDPSSGTISGTATVPGIASLTIAVTDSVGRTASKTLALHAVLPLTITNSTPLTPATISSAYSLLLIATGGTPPYTWSSGGTLPAGLLLNSTSGQLSGTPLVPGLSQFTITVTDSRSLTITSPFSLTTALQSVTIGGVSSSLSPAQQPSISLSLGGPYTVSLSGYLNLSFSSAVGGDDQSIQFSTGGRTVAFTLPAGTVQPLFGQSSSLAFSTGTVAGNVTVTATVTAGSANVTPSPAPSQSGAVAKDVPVLTAASLTRVTGGLNVSITGYSTTREVTSATITFNPAAGSTVKSAPLTVQLSSLFTTWYSSAASTAVGSSFTITLPFTVTGNTSAIGSATIVMTNSQGASQPITAAP